MKNFNFKRFSIIIKFLILLFVIHPSFTFGQNQIQLHKKDGKQKDDIVKRYREVKIITNNNQTLKGYIANVNDSTIFITESKTTAVAIENIKIFYCKKNIIANKIAGACFTALTIYAVSDIIYAFDPVFFLIEAVVFLPGPLIGSIYFLTHKKKYDLQRKYELKVVKI